MKQLETIVLMTKYERVKVAKNTALIMERYGGGWWW